MTKRTQIEELDFGKTTQLRLAVWKARRALRDRLRGKDILNTQDDRHPKAKIKQIYRQADSFLSSRLPSLVRETPREVAITMLRDAINEMGYTVVDEDTKRPWGAYFRLDSEETDRFIREFFPGLDPDEARLGRKDVELSPKFLLVVPGCRLSWQYHDRRAERWRFLTEATYYRGHSDTLPEPSIGKKDDIVQFDAGERHRLGSHKDGQSYSLVAEIWQHTDPSNPSDEADIVRLEDDYSR